jgi:tetratricopeptide (TPR) repeat protein
MEDAFPEGLREAAVVAFAHVDADPNAYGPPALALVAAARRAGDTPSLIRALRAAAWFERSRLDDLRAKELLDEAARLARRHAWPQLLGEVLVTRAAVNHELGRLAAAQRDIDRAAELVESGHAMQVQFQQAVLHQNIGRLSRAGEIYRRLLARPDCPIDLQGKIGNNLAIVEAQMGLPKAALAHLDRAAEAARQVGPALAASIVHTRGWVLVQAGRLPEGLALFDQAAAAFEAAHLPLGELYVEYADALADLRLVPEASVAAAQAVAQFAESGVPLMGAEAQLRSARLALLSGDADTAAEAAARAAATFRRQRRPAWAARAAVVAAQARAAGGSAAAEDLRVVRRAAATLQRLGLSSSAVEAHLAAGRLAESLGHERTAVDAYDRARTAARTASVLVRLHGRIAAARAARLRHDDAAVRRHARAGLTDVVRHRGALPSMELRALASGHGSELGRLGLSVVLRTGSPPQVLDWMERTRASALLTVEPPTLEGVEEPLARLRAAHAELEEARRQARPEPPGLVAATVALEAEVRRATWVRRTAGTGTGAGEPARGLTGLRRRLDGRTLVEYGVLDGDLFAVVVEPRRTRVVPLGPLQTVTRQADMLLFALRRLARSGPGGVAVPVAVPAVAASARPRDAADVVVRSGAGEPASRHRPPGALPQPRGPGASTAARASADAALGRLRDLLLGPVGVGASTPVVIVPVGRLHRIPWSALHAAPVAVAPSAAFWLRTSERMPSGPDSVVLVAGPDLPGAAAEVAALRDVHPGATVLVPPESTAEAVTRALRPATLAHLACHGRLRSDNPTFSSLVLSDGPLTVSELDSRGIAPHRIVLAACDSGADIAYEGDEVLGFVSALMARGTAGVVASVVAVPDVDAVGLMASMHRVLRRGETLPDALCAARSGLDRDDAGAFVTWAAFNAFGGA